MSVISPKYVDGLELYIEQLRSNKASLEQQLSALRAEREWISVDERLPDEREEVLVFDADSECVGLAWGSPEHWCVPEPQVIGDSVTHWMPLPTPPTTEEDGQ